MFPTSNQVDTKRSSSSSLGYSHSREGRMLNRKRYRLTPLRILALLSVFIVLWNGFKIFGKNSESKEIRLEQQIVLEEPARLFSDEHLSISPSFSPITPKNPLQIDSQLILSVPDQISVTEPLYLTFTCHHEMVSVYCPTSYRVLLVGPQMISPVYEVSNIIKSSRVVQVLISGIRDPGNYSIYAWPEHANCDLWNDAPVQYHKLAVEGTPNSIEIVGKESLEGLGSCQSIPEMLNGRWITKSLIEKKNLLSSSKHFNWLYSHFLSTFRHSSHNYKFAFIPYECKIPHLSFAGWIQLVKPPSLLLIGDSVHRDLFCSMIWPSLGGSPDDKQCKFTHDDKEAYHHSNKHFEYKLASGAISKIDFLWCPSGDAQTISKYLETHSPTHIIFNVALWLAKDPPQVYVQKVRPMLEILSQLKGAKIIARTSAGMVENIQCYDRIGQRKDLEENNAALLDLLKSYPTITPLDVYPIFNSRPDSTPDGRHTAGEGAFWMDRPETGSAETYVADIIFSSWLLPSSPRID